MFIQKGVLMFRVSVFLVLIMVFSIGNASAKNHLDLNVYVNIKNGVIEIDGKSKKPLVLPTKAFNVISQGEAKYKYQFPIPKPGGNGFKHKAELHNPEMGIYIPDYWVPGAHDGPKWVKLGSKDNGTTYKIKVTVDTPWKVILPGKIISEKQTDKTYSATFEGQKEHGIIPLIAGPYIAHEATFNKLTYRIYLQAPFEKLLPFYAKAAGIYLDIYEKKIGEFGLPSLSIVSSPLPTISHNLPGLTVLDIVGLKSREFIVSTLSHEILHNYWGSLVYDKVGFGNWSEGLTTYMSEYMIAQKLLPDLPPQLLKKWQASVQKADPISVLKFKGIGTPELQRIGYHKVALVFHMLRQRLGDDVFNRVTRRIWSGYKSNSVVWHDFQRIFAEESGKNVTPFFDTWVRGKKKPTMADLNSRKLDTGLAIVNKEQGTKKTLAEKLQGMSKPDW